ncbi:MAG: M48 family metallopeptidase [Oscillospiraceae bacterium]
MTGQAKRKITFKNGRELEYILDCKDRKNMYINIRSGRVTLKIPPAVSLSQADRFLEEKSEWIFKNLENEKTRSGEPKAFKNGERFRLAGEEYVITLEKSNRYFKPYFDGNKLVIAIREQTDEEYVKTQTEKALTAKAAEIIHERMTALTERTELVPKKVTIKKLSGSWGRCSSEGNISININIVFYEKECIDYVITHELCHLKHMDHSKDFWRTVEKYCPDWKRIRNSLR